MEFLSSISGAHAGLGALIVLIVLLLFSLVMLVISWKTGKQFALSLGPLRLALGGESAKDTSSDSPNIKLASNHDKLIILKNSIRDRLEKIQSIKTEDSLARQLKFADEKIIEIKSLITNRFAKFLEAKLPESENAKTHKDYRSYQIMIGLLANEMKEKILKQSFIENHLASYSELEWEEYINQKADLICTLGCEFLDVMYDDNAKVVTAKELSEGNHDIILAVKEMIKMIYRKAKFISLENDKRVQQMEAEFDIEMKAMFNLDSPRKN